jgi:demethylmenaquinone methyltransferase / 2-methoxy-6-polyprenyl-1,4-benzoquinol methylase
MFYRVDHVGWCAGPAEFGEEARSGEAVQECFEIEVRSDRHMGSLYLDRMEAFLSKRKSRSLRDEKQKHGLAVVYASVTARRRRICNNWRVRIVAEHEVVTGARPAGVVEAEAAAENIQRMFDAIAPTYDRANHLLSGGVDRWWWWRTARALKPILAKPEAVVVDLCCGTGDMTMALYKYRPKLAAEVPTHRDRTAMNGAQIPTLENEGAGVPTHRGAMIGAQTHTRARTSEGVEPILAVDFSRAMLELGKRKFVGKNIVAIEADALHLPMAPGSVDLVTAAFGFRNLASYPDGLRELHRVLRPGGEIAILECNQPEGWRGALYDLYFKRVLPVLGGAISRNRAAYRYLPASVERFPRPVRMLQLIAEAGFVQERWTSYTFGVAGLYRARKG